MEVKHSPYTHPFLIEWKNLYPLSLKYIFTLFSHTFDFDAQFSWYKFFLHFHFPLLCCISDHLTILMTQMRTVWTLQIAVPLIKWLHFKFNIATLCFSTEPSFSTLSPISERRYLVSGWSFMELLPAQYWIFVSMWHCFSRLEFTKGIWWKEPKDEWRRPFAKLMSAAIRKCTEFIKRIETQIWLWGSLFSFIFFKFSLVCPVFYLISCVLYQWHLPSTFYTPSPLLLPPPASGHQHIIL